MEKISRVWRHIHRTLFPFLDEVVGPLSEQEKKLAAVLELVHPYSLRLPLLPEKVFLPPLGPAKESCQGGRYLLSNDIGNLLYRGEV